MTISSERIYLTYKRRPEWNDCPKCGNPIKWLYIIGEWIPCTSEPKLFILDPCGKSTVIYRKEFFRNAVLYSKGDGRFSDGSMVHKGHVQHYYDCAVLKYERHEWAEQQRLRQLESNCGMS